MNSINFVEFYDQPEAGRHAHYAAVLLAAGLDYSADRCESIWRFDMLTEPNYAEQAHADANCADFLVIASCSPETIPQSVRNWLSARSHNLRPNPTLIHLFPESGNWQAAIADVWGEFASANPVQAAKAVC